MTDLMEFISSCATWAGVASIRSVPVAILILFVLRLSGDGLPTRFRSGLWLILLLRLSLPWMPESRLSIANVLPARVFPSALSEERSETVLSEARQNQLPTEMEHTEGVASSRQLQLNGLSLSKLRISLLPLLHGIWLLGAVAVLGCALLQTAASVRALRRSRFVTNEQFLSLLEDCKQEIGCSAYLGVVETDHVSSPALFGVLRPRLLLPKGTLTSLTSDQMRHVLLHELAHLKRGDIIINWISALVQALHWFNPLVWYALGRFRADRELACDALAMARSSDEEAREYGRTFVHLLEQYTKPKVMPALAGIVENHNEMKRRITMITNLHQRRTLRPLIAGVLTGVIGIASLTSAVSEESSAPLSRSKAVVAIEELKVTPYREAGLFTLSAKLTNKGADTVPAFDLNFERVDKTDRKLGTGGIHGAGPLAPGQEWREGSMPFALKEGTNVLAVQLDPDGKVLDKGDHSKTIAVEFREGRIVDSATSSTSTRTGSGARIVIEGSEIQPYPEGGLHSLVVRYKNMGNVAAPQKLRLLFLKGVWKTPPAEDKLQAALADGLVSNGGPLDAGAVTSAGSMPFALKEGTNEFTIFVDPDHVATESGSDANRCEVKVQVHNGKIANR